jgi:hypothetical protein
LARLELHSPSLSTFPNFQVPLGAIGMEYSIAGPKVVNFTRLASLLPLQSTLRLGDNFYAFRSLLVDGPQARLGNIRQLDLKLDDCDDPAAFSVQWEAMTDLQDLFVTCNTLTHLKLGMLPQSEQLVELTIFSKPGLKHIDASVWTEATSQASTTIISSPLVSCFPGPNARLSCNCADPPYQGIAFCPTANAFACPDGSNMALSAVQVCDGQRDCADGYDENFCSGTLEMVTASALSALETSNAIKCVQTVTVTMTNGTIRMLQSAPDCDFLLGAQRHWHAGEGDGDVTFAR